MAVNPYVSAAAFAAHPTYLDLDGLRRGVSDPDAQTAELTNLLLQASEWADNEADQPLGAHLYNQRERTRATRSGQLAIHADHGPVRQITGVGYGWSQNALTTVAAPGSWVEQGTNMVIPMAGASVAWSGSLQFGAPAAGGELFAQVEYVAGHVATVLEEPATAGDLQIMVTDPTGLEPGARYRIWEPGVEETVAVHPDWVAPVPSASPLPTLVTLASALRYDHAAGHDLSGMPGDMRLAVVLYTVSLLIRPDSTAEDEFPDNSSSTTRKDDTRPTGMGLVKEARRILMSYARVR
ncbi:hypothetical protein [Streptomyces sp. NPDC050738]|uniref:hypothetical protein n=1 Tax=Streptomyces sp. NPDC050738 TaxID=3154744 RepID=UPI003448816A